MKLNRLISGLSLIALIALATSCRKDFEEINKNPNGLEDVQIPLAPRFAIPQQSVIFNVNNTSYEYQLFQNLNGDVYSGYMMSPTPYGGNLNNLNYFMMIGWNGLAFEKGNSNIIKPINIILQESWRLKYVDYAAVARIIKVAGMHRICDLYGPIPYTKAGQGGFTTPYDSQESVYKEFFKELTLASDSIDWFVKNDPGFSLKPSRISEFDQVCGGDIQLWARFANTLRLRLAIRIAAVAPLMAQEEAEKAISAPGGLLHAGDKFIAASHPNLQNPLFVMCYEYADMRAGAPFLSVLKGYNDPRLPMYITPIEKDIKNKDGQNVNVVGDYIGIRNGIEIQDKSEYLDFSNIVIEKPSTVNPLIWMKPSETYFLLAEGALRKWNVGGTAEEFYTKGIITSFAENKVSALEANEYLEVTTTAQPYVDVYNSKNSILAGSKWLNDVPVKWDNSASKEKQLQRIITQKWIAIFPDGLEGWAEFRRTGYPKLFPVVVNNSNGTIKSEEFIRRLPFPDSEVRTNKQELDIAIANYLKGPDTGGTRLWWDVNAIVTGDNKL